MSYTQFDEIELESASSNGRFSETSSSYVQLVVDKIHLAINEMDKQNARIRKKLQKFESLDKQERQEVREQVSTNMKSAENINKEILKVTNENQKMKFDNLLSKKVSELETLSQSLLYKEKDLLIKYQDQLEEVDLEENQKMYERKRLLQSDSEEESNEEDEFELGKYDNKVAIDQEEETKVSMQDRIQFEQQDQAKMQIQEEQEIQEFQLESHEDYVKKRTDKISKVATSLTKIHKMYENLNQIVVEQGETLTRLEDNVCCSRNNTKRTVDELRITLKNEKSIRDRLCGCDFGIMCLSVWFIIAVVFFLLDLSIST